MQHKLLFSAIALALSYSAQAVIVPEGTQLDEKQHIVINNGAEPQSFDPQKTEGVPESAVAYQLLEGLVTSDSEGKLQPGVAESWENTPDFKTWTFHLRKDAKWSNGDPVTAHDFVFAWRRLVDPATAAPYASYLSYLQVENAQDIIDGKKKPAELGVEAKDDYTFVVHATNPVPYAVSLTTHQSLLPLPQKVVEKLGDAWVKKENYVGNGAYKLANHIINEKIEFERNPLYWNDKETVINSATFLAIENPSTDVARYRAGDLDMTNYGLPPEQFAKLQKELPGEVYITRTLATYSYELNNKKAPFDNVNIRKALNLSLDRNVITDKVLGQGQTPTYVFTPTYIEEGQLIQQPAYSKEPMAQRNEEAIKLLEEAGYSKANPLKFSILYNTNENHKKVAIAAASMWKANTKGLIDVKLENQEWKTYIDSRHHAPGRARGRGRRVAAGRRSGPGVHQARAGLRLRLPHQGPLRPGVRHTGALRRSRTGVRGRARLRPGVGGRARRGGGCRGHVHSAGHLRRRDRLGCAAHHGAALPRLGRGPSLAACHGAVRRPRRAGGRRQGR